jgi:hypothetical protein
VIWKRTPIPLTEFLPKSGFNIRPLNWDHERQICGFFGEMKRTCDQKHVKQKLRKFVCFYKKLLKYRDFQLRWLHKKGPEGLVTVNLEREMTQLIADPSTPLIFCYNGSDCVTAWNELLKAVQKECGGDGSVSTIRGHQVIIIFCKSDELTKWQDLQILERDLHIAEQEKARVSQELHIAEQEKARVSQELLATQEELESLKAHYHVK